MKLQYKFTCWWLSSLLTIHITNKHLYFHGAVRAIRHVNGGSFSSPRAPKPQNRFSWNFACLIMSTARPHMQHMTAAVKGVGGEIRWWVKLHPACFLVPWTHPQLTPRNVYFRSMHPKCVLVVGAFLWGSVCPVVKIFAIYPPKPLSMDRLRL